jgi:hypothetical protein
MAGYSGKSLVQKLGIQPGFCIFVEGAPAAYGGFAPSLKCTRLAGSSCVDVLPYGPPPHLYRDPGLRGVCRRAPHRYSPDTFLN